MPEKNTHQCKFGDFRHSINRTMFENKQTNTTNSSSRHAMPFPQPFFALFHSFTHDERFGEWPHKWELKYESEID